MGETKETGRTGSETPDTPLTNQPSEGEDMAPTHSIKSKKSPAFQTYPADFLNDDAVEDMTFTEIGVYWVMLCKDWLGNGLPIDFHKIAKRISSGNHEISAARLKKLWEGPIARCFTAKGERLYNPRLEHERKKQRTYSKEQSERGKLGGRPKPPLSNPESTGFPLSKPRARDETETKRVSVVVLEEKDLDVKFAKFRDAYPAERRKGGYLVQQQFLAAVENAGGSAALMSALTNHIASEQWSNPRHIPGMDVWLNEERWRQVLPAVGESEPEDRRTPAWARGL